MTARIALYALALVAAPHIASADNDDCPPAFRGASITAAEIHDGVTLTFTTAAPRIDQMRTELRAVAVILEQKGTEVQTASYDEDVAFPPVDLEVFDISGGARVSVRASRPRDIPELRELAKSFERFWAASKCHGDMVAARPQTNLHRRRYRRRSAH